MGTFLFVLMSQGYFRNIAHDLRVTLYKYDSVTLSWLEFVCWCWQIGYKDLAAGKRATRRNEVWGVLVFHANYSLMIRERITFLPIIKLTFPETVNNSYIDAYLDMSSEF